MAATATFYTTFGLKVCTVNNNSGNIRDVSGDVGAELLHRSEGEASKIFIPVIVNGFRITGHLDSGSDVLILQCSLYLNLKRATNYAIDSIHTSTVKNVNSFSRDIIPVFVEIFVNLKFSKETPSSRFCIFVIKDIGVTPPLLLGDSGISFIQPTV